MKRAGFTLIELLIVIAIIALLIALSVTVLRASRQRARTALCASRIRQMMLDLQMYDTDHGTFPPGFVDSYTSPPGGNPGDPSRDRVGWWWFNFLSGYDGVKEPLLHCPSKVLSHPSLKGSVLYGNYGVNRSVFKSPGASQREAEEFTGTPLGGGDVTGGTLLIVDNGYGITGWWHAADMPPWPLDSGRGEDTAYVPGLEINKNKKLLAGQQDDAINGRHPNKTVNVGFGDNHVSTVKAHDLLVQKTADGYANKSPLWSPK